MLKLIGILFAAGFIANMLIVQKAERMLTISERKLLDDSLLSRGEKLLPLILIGCAVYVLIKALPAYDEMLFISGLALALLTLWASHFTGVKRLKEAGLPVKYISAVVRGGYFYLIPMTLGGIAIYLWNIKVIS
jgi:hypothetical protein